MTLSLHPGLACTDFWTGDQAIQIDHETIQRQSELGLQLMEQAGHWVAMAALARYRLSQNLVIIAGNGNNGGDALVAARILLERGLRADVWLISQDPKQLSPSRQIQAKRLSALGVSLNLYRPGRLQVYRDRPIMVIDGLLGLGLKGGLRPGVYQTCLKELAELKAAQVIAIDLPSGMSADNWQQPPALLQAQCTVTFGAAKPVHYFAPSCDSCGEVLVDSLNFDADATRRALKDIPPRLAYLSRIDSQKQFLKIWQHLGPSSHKFERGHVLVAGGSPGKYGAAIMAARSAAAAGAGWVSLALPTPSPNISLPPYLTEEFGLFQNGQLAVKPLLDFIQARKLKALVIGPGCISSPVSLELLSALHELTHKRQLLVILDAGALHGITRLLERLGQAFDPDKFLLTPHPGEWQRMGHELPPIGDFKTLEQARLKFLEELGVSVLYKTATPISPQPPQSQHLAIISSQTHLGLARAGSGDLLAGIAAVIGLNHIPAYLAGLLAHQWLAQAARQAASKTSTHGLLPTDLLLEIQKITD